MAVKLHIRKKYYKHSRKGRMPVSFQAKQPGGTGTDVHATLYMDPVLKKHKDLRKGLIRHEKEELRAWGSGKSGGHTIALRKEPKLTRDLGGTSGFWKEIEKRKRGN
ncbi:hypothetical protein LCGC14_1556010 [marine sediment metagenome]|uniref:Uncharacterized protein n=1 Tax=marine sediment metagenome TaxID=412755 RepID=A0A0F9J9X3_9ZZZZ